jgi:hypothetical protein
MDQRATSAHKELFSKLFGNPSVHMKLIAAEQICANWLTRYSQTDFPEEGSRKLPDPLNHNEIRHFAQ